MDVIAAPEILRFIAALVLVVGLMLGLALVMRRVNDRAGLSLGQKRRMKIVESLAIDHRRRMILVRCDDSEHLVILGPTGETVVQCGIVPPQETPAP
jgi:flagellar protein FliO/FliZ